MKDEPTPESEIVREFRVLHENVEALSVAINTLHERLKPIVMDMPIEGGVEGKVSIKPGCYSLFGQHIDTETCNIQISITRLQNLMQSLAL